MGGEKKTVGVMEYPTRFYRMTEGLYGYIWIVHIYKPRIRFVVPHIQVPPSTNSESFSQENDD